MGKKDIALEIEIDDEPLQVETIVVTPDQIEKMESSIFVSEDPRFELAEKNLVAAIMARTMHDLIIHNLSRYTPLKLEYTEAKAWIKSNVWAPFSFIWCCQHLDLVPKVVRDRFQDIETQSRLHRGRGNLRSFLHWYVKADMNYNQHPVGKSSTNPTSVSG